MVGRGGLWPGTRGLGPREGLQGPGGLGPGEGRGAGVKRWAGPLGDGTDGRLFVRLDGQTEIPPSVL